MKREMSAAEALTKALIEFRKQGVQRHHAPGELGRAEGQVLVILSEIGPENPGLRVSDLAKDLSVTPSTLTQTTTSLFRLGYIVRVPDSVDRRVIRVRLTSGGRSMVTKYVKDFNDYSARIAEFLGEKDSFLFAKLLGKVSSFMESAPWQVRIKPQSKEPKHHKPE